MYRPSAYAVDDRARLHAFIRAYPFATLAVAGQDGIRFAYAPVVVGETPSTLRFHLAAMNPFCAIPDGASLSISLMGPNAYVSPDWYVTPSLVPTWNYIAVEATGRARRLDGAELRQLLEDLSAAEEARLLPKVPWTLEKVPVPRLDALTSAIVGFAVPLDRIAGKFKLSQDKSADDRAGAVAGLETRGDSTALVSAMRAI